MASKSDVLRRFLGKRMGDSLLKAVLWQYGRGVDGEKLESDIKQQREAVLRKAGNGEGQEVCTCVWFMNATSGRLYRYYLQL